MKISFNQPFLGREEIIEAAKVIKSGQMGGNRLIGQKVENFITRAFKVKYALLTTSCTHALEMAMMALKIGRDDEVILPSFSFVSVANAIIRSNARPVFVDIESDCLNIDPAKIRKALTRKTKAIVCVHYGGISCEMDEIARISSKRGIYLIEDAAQAVGSKHRDKFLGSIGDVGCFSFHETKNITCGEGGAFLTNNEQLANRAEVIREKGTDRSKFLKGKVDKYTWKSIGSSYVLSELLAAVLYAQLKKMRHVIDRRKAIGLYYIGQLKDLEKAGKITLPKFYVINKGFNWHIFYFLVQSYKQRERILKGLKKRGIEATSHFVPLHLSPYARKIYGYKRGIFPTTEKISETLIRLPLYPALSINEQKYIIESVYECVG